MERDSVRDVDGRMPVIVGAGRLTDHDTPPERSVPAAATFAALEDGEGVGRPGRVETRNGRGAFRLDG